MVPLKVLASFPRSATETKHLQEIRRCFVSKPRWLSDVADRINGTDS